MRALSLAWVSFLLSTAAFAQPSPLINEVEANTIGFPDAAEFIELYNPGTTPIALDPFVLVFYNGAFDTVYRAYDLDGFTIAGGDYFVLAGNPAMVPNTDMDVFPNTLLIQNGADAIALYRGSTADFPFGTGVTTTNLVDAIVYGIADPDDAGLLPLLLAGQPQVDEEANGNSAGESMQRCPNGGSARVTMTYLTETPSPGVGNRCSCGNNVVDSGEECDDGARNGTASSCCTITCTYEPPDTACVLPIIGTGRCNATPDGCDATGVCIDLFEPAGTLCRASTDICDPEEVCDGTTQNCPADTTSPDGTDCDTAGLFCDGPATCMSGTCTSGPAPVCMDGDACTMDSCVDPGGCTTTPIPDCCNVSSECDDADLCTVDACSGAGGTCTSSPITDCCVDTSDCDDGSACTTDTCNVGINTCDHTPIAGCCTTAADCDDSNSCTTDTCMAGGLCDNAMIAGCCQTDGDCDDSNMCTFDECSVSDTCTNFPVLGCTNDGGVPIDDAGIGLDAGPGPALDAGPGTDAGTTPPVDSGGVAMDSGARADAGTGVMDGGCGCRVGARRDVPLAGWALALLAVVCARRRRRSAPNR